MKRIISIFLLTILLVFKSYSCGNEYYTFDYKGNKILFEGLSYSDFDKNFNLELNVSKIKKLIKKLKKDRNYMLLSDYALCLLKLGKRKEPLEILVHLNKYYPDDYKIAANLGTAYELNGQVDSALKYIKRDLILNPNDHQGSEWIHVKVLETKLELKKNPAYLKEHSVLNLTQKQKNDPTVFRHIILQLKERVPFSPEGADEIMASLFTDLGDISSNIKSIAYARAYYLMAEKYYGSDSPSIDLKIKELEKLINKYINQANKAKAQKDSTNKKTRILLPPETIIGYIKYQDLLKNNNPQNYEINWSKINTDVTALLALIDTTKTAGEIIATENANSSDSTDALKLIPEHIHSDSANISNSQISKTAINNKKTAMNEGGNIWIYICSGLIVLFLGYLIRSKFKKK
jgi:tetratricopeptide (TPR) repeat protein